MYIGDMVDLLSLRLEDAKKGDFPDDLKIKALTNAQINVAFALPNEYLTELEHLEEDLTATGGVALLSALTHDVLKGSQGILNVKIKDDLFCTRLKVDDLKKREISFLSGKRRNPLWYPFQKKIYVDNGQTDPHVDIYYLKVPTTIRYQFAVSELTVPADTGFLGDTSQGLSTTDDYYIGGVVYCIGQKSYHVITAYDAIGAVPGTDDRKFTVAPAAAANFGDDEIYFISHSFDELNLTEATIDLNEAFHELVVSFAEVECWKMDNKLDRAKVALDTANQELGILLSTYKIAEGIGTGGRE